jgi:hypothetical protein
MKPVAALALAAGLLALPWLRRAPRRGRRAARRHGGGGRPGHARTGPQGLQLPLLLLPRLLGRREDAGRHLPAPPPRDFTRGAPLDAPAILATVREGRGGTAMKSFRGILDEREMTAVAAFVAREFVRDKAPNTAYHTPRTAGPITGDSRRVPVRAGARSSSTRRWSRSIPRRSAPGGAVPVGLRVLPRPRAHVADEGPAWSSRPLSYPRMGFVPGQDTAPPVDAVSSASVYAKHEVVPRVEGLDARSGAARNCSRPTARSATAPTAPARTGSASSWSPRRAT